MHYSRTILAVFAAAAHSATLPQAGFSKDEISAIERGHRVVRALHTDSPDQVAFAGGVRLPIGLSTYLQRLRAGTLYRTGENVLQIGRFSEAPSIADLRDFRIGGDERLGKEALVTAIRDFEQSGTTGIGPLVKQAAWLRDRMPAAYEYLLRYPKAPSRGVDDFYIWTELQFGLRPVTRVAQVSIWEGRGEAFVITRQIYANRYFEASFQIDHLCSDGDSVYLTTLNYGRSSILGSLAGKLIRPIVVSRTLALAEKTLDQAARDLRAGR